MDRVEVAGLEIAYERVGSGPALVLLHGFVADGPTTWGPQLDGLSDAFTVVAWDAPGAGRSSDPPEDLGLAGYAECLDGFLRGLGLTSAPLVGLSFGGILALGLQRRRAARSSGLVLAGAYAGWAGSLGAEAAEERLRTCLALAEATPDAFAAALLPMMFASEAGPEGAEAFRDAVRRFRPRGFRAMARASAEDARDVLPSIDVPTLLLYGERDRRAPTSVGESLRVGIPGSRLVVLPGAGHVCNLEDPAAFNAAVRDFLAS
jgi:pimeloyl-ACP methyl ester carboxylesterase